MNTQIWWYLARATGVVAWASSVGAVIVGLALAARASGKQVPPAWLLALHRHLGAITVAFIAGHIGALIADSYVEFGLADVLVPFRADGGSAAVAWGVLAMWAIVVVEVTSLARRRLPRRLWRAIHLVSYAAAVAATAHLLTAGTDAGNHALRWAVVVAIAAMSGLLCFRLLLPGRRARTASRAVPGGSGEPLLTSGARTRH